MSVDQTTHAVASQATSTTDERSLDPTIRDLELALRAPSASRRRRGRRAHLRLADVLRRHRVSLPLVTGLLALVGFVNAVNMYRSPGRFDDEGTYVAQAWAVVHWHELAHYTYWYDHPPLGWLQVALWTWLTPFLHAPNAVGTGRQLLLVVTVVSSGLLYVVARRLGIARVFALLGTAAFGLSPLAVHYHRMVFLDNLVTPWLLAALALALSPRRRLAAHAGAGVCFAVAVLTKETTLLLAPFVLYLLVQQVDRRIRRYSIAVTGTLFVLVASGYVLYALLKNELLAGAGHVSLEFALRFQLLGRASNGSVFDPTSAAHDTVHQWLALDPWLLGAALALVPVCLVRRPMRPVAAALAFLVAMMLRPGYLPNPYLIGLLPLAALCVAGGTDALWSWRPGARRAVTSRARPARLGWTLVSLVSPLLALGVLGASVNVVKPWTAGDRRLMHYDEDRPVRLAEDWVYTHVRPTSRVLVDDALWLDLVNRGWDPHRGVVWNLKVDSDPAVANLYPDQPPGQKWRDFDYLVETETIRATAATLTNTQGFTDHSDIVAAWGSGHDLVNIRRIRP